MKKHFLYGLALVLMAVLASLIAWQGSFSFGEYGPSSPEQTFLFWAVSTLVFLLTVILGFMLFRTGVKLYIERQNHKQGTGIRLKLVVGALALSFLPVFFLVLWSYEVLNLNLNRWFSMPGRNVEANLIDIGKAFQQTAHDKAKAEARWIAALPETRDYLENGRLKRAFFERLCRDNGIREAFILRDFAPPVRLCEPDSHGNIKTTVTADAPAGDARVAIAQTVPLDFAVQQAKIQNSINNYEQLAENRKFFRSFYLRLLLLITLFILFVATWIAIFLARQISIPIAALLDAAREVRGGNLSYRVRVNAIDELATLVRGFNEMTQDLETNRGELERRRRFTEAILESIPTGVISLSSDGRIQLVNRALSQIFPPEQVAKATRLDDLLSREDAAEIRYLTKRARRTGVASRQLELKQGKQTLHLSVTVAALEERVTSGIVVVLEDTSELLRAQKAAAWHEVARRIAHEIKNPLTPIALCAERIARQLDRISPPADVERILRECSVTISKEVESVRILVDEFAQFARFPAAQKAPADINEVVEEALAVFTGRLEGIEVRKELAGSLPPVNIDRDQFKRVIINLVDNAAEAMQDSMVRRLLVATQALSAETVELIIADTGCGISTEDRERLFLPYFSTKGRGTGLGLAIVHHILADHDAEIRVEDNLPAGARFLVEIPALAPAEPETKTVETRA